MAQTPRGGGALGKGVCNFWSKGVFKPRKGDDSELGGETIGR